MNSITLNPAQVLEDGRIKLSATLAYGMHRINQYLIVEPDGLAPDQLVHNGDVWAVLFLHKMMEIGGAFHVNSSLSKSLWRGLDNYVKAWSCSWPDEYSNIELTADEMVDDSATPQPQRALSCFSGGMDACFTAFRHVKGIAGAQTLPLQACLMVHGADIRLDYVGEWKAAVAASREMVADLGVKHMYTVETNFREMHCNYGMAYFSMLVACMRVFGKEYGYMVLGNDGHYNYFRYPHGNNPVTNHYLSSRACEVVTDGAEYTRTEKAKLLSQWPKALEKLRVCWQGEDLSKNCGKCNKCKRTQFNFLAVGAGPLPCMPPTTIEELMQIDINTVEYKELSLIMQYLEEHPLEPMPEWVAVMREKLAMGPVEKKRKKGLFARLFRRRKKVGLGRTIRNSSGVSPQ